MKKNTLKASQAIKTSYEISSIKDVVHLTYEFSQVNAKCDRICIISRLAIFDSGKINGSTPMD